MEDLEATLIWLEKEHEDAKAVVELARISDCSSWNERRYIAKKASHEEDRMVRKNAAQFEVSVKVARRAGVDIKAQINESKIRASASGRVERDEALRNSWAERGVQVLKMTGWLAEEDMEDEQKLRRLLLRMKRGLRVRTIKLRVLALEKVAQWSKCALDGPFPQCAEEYEDFLIDLSEDPKAGVSTYERSRYAMLNLESAAEKDKEDCFANSDRVKATVKELTRTTASLNSKPKKQAPQILAKLLEALEKIVANEGHKDYTRGYAWLKLVAFWAVLRGKDSNWVCPKSLRWSSANGLQGEVTQTKTIGPDCKVKSRAILISNDAYLVDRSWLQKGFEIWKEAPEDRQNFISLPTANCEGFRPVGAEPHDRAALTRWIYRTALEEVTGDQAEEMPEVLDAAARFWTEHSSRATLVSIARALVVPKSLTDRIGWWAVGDSASEEYIRTYRTLTARVQAKAAAFVRRGLARPTRDITGHVLEALGNFLKDKGKAVDEQEYEARCLQLLTYLTTYAEAGDEPSGLGDTRYGWAEDAEGLTHEALQRMEALKLVESSEEEGVSGGPPTKIGDWVVSVTRTHCLHIIGKCFRVPGKHYIKWAVVEDPVPKDKYRKSCNVCFPKGYPLVNVISDETILGDLAEGMPGVLEEEDETSSYSSNSSA